MKGKKMWHFPWCFFNMLQSSTWPFLGQMLKEKNILKTRRVILMLKAYMKISLLTFSHLPNKALLHSACGEDQPRPAWKYSLCHFWSLGRRILAARLGPWWTRWWCQALLRCLVWNADTGPEALRHLSAEDPPSPRRHWPWETSFSCVLLPYYCHLSLLTFGW